MMQVESNAIRSLLVAMCAGARWLNALRRDGKPCRIRIPDDPAARTKLFNSHVRGAAMTLTFHADGHDSWQERVQEVVLAALCPAEGGRCTWLGIDLDGADHGARGLADPVQAARCIAERAAQAGLIDGMLVARSRRGCGRHAFLILTEPVDLRDAVLGVGSLAAAAFNVAASDVEECGAPHAFRRTNGAIARPGDAGAIELVPHSLKRPPHGWALTLPGAGSFAAQGGGVIVDPFDDQPVRLDRVPRCDHRHWSQFIREAKSVISKRAVSARASTRRRRTRYYSRYALDLIDDRTRTFLDGRAPQGTRNDSAFAASANLLGCGVDERETEHLILAGADACGLPQREARAAFRSAMRAMAQKRGRP